MVRVQMLLLFIVSFLLVGCASSNYGNNPAYEKINDRVSNVEESEAPNDMRSIQDIPQFEDTENLMAPGFLFSLSHPTDGKLQGTFRAGFDGILKLPYGVKISVVGLTYEELRNKVLDSYNRFFQRGAQNVNFILLSKDYWIEVRGFVKKSGQYLVKRKESIDKVLDNAGGLKGDIKSDFYIASIKQKNISYSVSLNQYYENNVLGVSFTWTGGDVVFINQSSEDSTMDIAPTVEVLGGVQKPGKSLYKEGANIFYYLGKRGGTMQNLGYKEAFVFRKTNQGLVRINFNLTDPNTIPVIKPGDSILINAERQTQNDRAWMRATQIGSILTTLAFLILAF